MVEITVQLLSENISSFSCGKRLSDLAKVLTVVIKSYFDMSRYCGLKIIYAKFGEYWIRFVGVGKKRCIHSFKMTAASIQLVSQVNLSDTGSSPSG